MLLLSIGVVYWWKSPHTVQGPSSDHEFEYIVRISGNSSSSDALPMVIALHGNGDTPGNFFDTLLKRVNYPARFIVVRGPIEYPGVSLRSRAWPTDMKGLREYGDALSDAMLVLKDDYPTVGRPIVLGFSGGASVAYYLAAFHSDQFSYIFPLSGRLPGIQMADEKTLLQKGAKVIAFHGKNDQLIRYNNGKAAVGYLSERGVNAELVTVNGGHLSVFGSANNLFLNYLSDALKEIVP